MSDKQGSKMDSSNQEDEEIFKGADEESEKMSEEVEFTEA